MRRLPIALSVLATAFAVPASAQAATLTFDRPCFAAIPGSAPDQPLGFTLAGGTPGLNWSVTSEATSGIFGVDARGVFDASGVARGAISSYTIRGLSINASRGRQGVFTAKQGTGLFGQTPIAQSAVTATTAALNIELSGRRSVYRKRSWKMSGISTLYGGSNTYYASWVKGTRGKRVVKRARLGRAKGACGYLATKRVLPPARRSGSWTVFVHSGKKLNKKKAISQSFRVFRF